MANKTQILKIDDTDYEMTQLGCVEGLEIYDRLSKELGPAVTQGILKLMTEKNAEAHITFIVVQAITTLPSDFKKHLWVKFAGLSKVKAGNLMLPLGDGLKLEVAGTYDQHFAGRFGHMTRWLLASLKWSFGDFLPDSGESSDAPPAATT
jgi:hypothetical protein